jgi:signal recognition particle GTPase
VPQGREPDGKVPGCQSSCAVRAASQWERSRRCASRLALLEADVNYNVVKEFAAAVREKALGAEVLASLSPDQHFIKIVHAELAKMMGGQAQELDLARRPPVSVMLVGLQGSGKTTSCGKLALFLQKKKRTPFLVPADVYRPAAIEQLKVLGARSGSRSTTAIRAPTRWRSAGKRSNTPS